MRSTPALLLIVLGAGCATAETPRRADETAIPFMSSLGEVEWQAASDDSLYLRGGNGDWYFVTTTNRCTRLKTSLALGFDVSAANQLDRHGALLVQGQRCPVASITRSDAPPKKRRGKSA
jgi:hypothetical protein